MAKLKENQTGHYTQQKRRELDVACVDSEYTWKKGHIVSISYEKEMKKSGNFGCTIVARMRKREKSSDGGRYWIT